MATQTTYYNLIKPALSDPADIADINTNSDTIDSTLHSLNSQISNLNSKVVITATLTASSYSVSATAASGYSLSSIKADMVACGYRVTSGSMSSLTSDVTVTTSSGAATVACSSAPTASVTLEIYLI